MLKKLVITLALSSSIFAQDFNPQASWIACTNGSDYHDSTSIRIERFENTVTVSTDGIDSDPYSAPQYDYFAAGMMRIRFTNQLTGKKENLKINFMTEPVVASLNGSDFEFECISSLL